VAASGTLVYVMRGNRDFMLGERFCREAGAILLDDPAILTLHGERLVLSHGDGLGVDDRAYQRLRAIVRDDSCALASPDCRSTRAGGSPASARRQPRAPGERGGLHHGRQPGRG
jgi:UDP-2,3-diacylglucosamine hydrolase